MRRYVRRIELKLLFTRFRGARARRSATRTSTDVHFASQSLTACALKRSEHYRFFDIRLRRVLRDGVNLTQAHPAPVFVLPHLLLFVVFIVAQTP